MKDTFKIIVKTRGTDGQYVEQEMIVDKKTNKCYEGQYLIIPASCEKYEVKVMYEAYASKKRNDVPVLEFKSTNLKNKIEEKDGFFYYFLLFFIIFWIIVYLFLFCV